MDARPREGRYFALVEVLFWSSKWTLCKSIIPSPKSRGGPFTPKWTQSNMVFVHLLSVPCSHGAGAGVGVGRRV
ncbi:hypothetical protein V6N12_018256 [Hibiscus sabdariffa]|uniref:Uncharacterized protein n=1 Tax=Hibiscus sabdariffa TaxID=183260 RepID=A0ABR2BRE7_9ROSI